MITLESLIGTISKFTLLDAVDIILLAIGIYYVLRLASRTRAMSVLRGIGLIIVLAAVARWIGLQGLSWVLQYLINAGALVMIILFQPELRRALEQIGRGKLIESKKEISVNDRAAIQSIVHALLNMSKGRVGALVVVQRYVALGDIIETGTELNAKISTQLLESIFLQGTPLHDGATIIQDNEIIAAGCFLPLSDRADLPQSLGTRHRAALGLSEVSDALCFVVSEETGTISLASEGQLRRNLDAAAIRKALITGIAQPSSGSAFGLLDRFKLRGRKNG